jgi:hypothetical protein
MKQNGRAVCVNSGGSACAQGEQQNDLALVSAFKGLH